MGGPGRASGAVVDGETTTFRGLGTGHARVDVVLRDRVVPMTPEHDGLFSVVTGGGRRAVPLPVDGDARSRIRCRAVQPDGVRGPSQIVDPARFPWTDARAAPAARRRARRLRAACGTFSARRDVRRRGGPPRGPRRAGCHRDPLTAGRDLSRLALAGVTTASNQGAATAPTVDPKPSRGSSTRRTVHGLGVIVDVVYNHLGPGSEASVSAFGPYVTDARHTLWGDAIDYRLSGVREWAIQNAEVWVRDYQVDGLPPRCRQRVHDADSPVTYGGASRSGSVAVDRHTLVIVETTG